MAWLPFVFLCGNPAERIQEDSSISRSRSVKGRFRFLHGEKEWLFCKSRMIAWIRERNIGPVAGRLFRTGLCAPDVSGIQAFVHPDSIHADVPPRRIAIMKRRNLVPAFVLPTVLAAATLPAQTVPGTQEDMKPQSPEQDVQADANALPRTIFPGPRKAVAGHVQGMAVDLERRHVYFSYTTELVKTDFEGKVLGSVKGLTGHLGCISYNPEDGKVYGSLEFKNDAIGRSIRKSIAEAQNGAADGDAPVAVGFYVAAFDGQNITRPDMDAEDASVLKTVFLREVCDDHTATVVNNGRQVEHRFGCSGIDGTTLAPGFGADRGRTFVYVAYGVYKDATRTDNDYQVILAYDLETLAPYWSRHTREGLHRNGPDKPMQNTLCTPATRVTAYRISPMIRTRATSSWPHTRGTNSSSPSTLSSSSTEAGRRAANR